MVTRAAPCRPPVLEVKMLIENRPTIGLIRAQLVLFQIGEAKKKTTPKQAKKPNRGVQLPSHPGKHKELGCWPSPSKPSSVENVSHVATTTTSKTPSLLTEVAG